MIGELWEYAHGAWQLSCPFITRAFTRSGRRYATPDHPGGHWTFGSHSAAIAFAARRGIRLEQP